MEPRRLNPDLSKFHILYRTTCLITGKFYIGIHSTDDLNDRYLGSGKRIKLSIKKHGVEAHERVVLEVFKSRVEAFIAEEKLVDSVIGSKKCMNLARGGRGPMKGYIVTVETRAKMSKAFKGKNKSQEHKEKIGLSHRGKKKPPLSDSHKHAISTFNSGKFVSEETKLKQSQSLTGRKLSKDHIEKMRIANLGKIISAECRRKISEANSGANAGTARTWQLTNPAGEVFIVDDLFQFCLRNNLGYKALQSKGNRTDKTPCFKGQSKGWSAIRLEK